MGQGPWAIDFGARDPLARSTVSVYLSSSELVLGPGPEQNKRDQAMSGLIRRLFPAITALMMVFWLAACAGETQADAEGGEGSGEHAAMEGEGELETGGEQAQ